MYYIIKMELHTRRSGSLTEVYLGTQAHVDNIYMFKRVDPELVSYEDLGKHCEFSFNFSDISRIDIHKIDETVFNVLREIGIDSGNFDFQQKAFDGMKRMLIEDLEIDEDSTINEIKEAISNYEFMTVEDVRSALRNGDY